MLMFSNRKLSLFVMMTLALSLFLAACGGGNGKEGSTGSGNNKEVDTEEEVHGGDLIIATLSDASVLDPQGSSDVPSANIQSNIFDSLIKKDKDGLIIPEPCRKLGTN